MSYHDVGIISPSLRHPLRAIFGFSWFFIKIHTLRRSINASRFLHKYSHRQKSCLSRPKLCVSYLPISTVFLIRATSLARPLPISHLQFNHCISSKVHSPTGIPLVLSLVRVRKLRCLLHAGQKSSLPNLCSPGDMLAVKSMEVDILERNAHSRTCGRTIHSRILILKPRFVGKSPKLPISIAGGFRLFCFHTKPQQQSTLNVLCATPDICAELNPMIKLEARGEY